MHAKPKTSNRKARSWTTLELKHQQVVCLRARHQPVTRRQQLVWRSRKLLETSSAETGAGGCRSVHQRSFFSVHFLSFAMVTRSGYSRRWTTMLGWTRRAGGTAQATPERRQMGGKTRVHATEGAFIGGPILAMGVVALMSLILLATVTLDLAARQSLPIFLPFLTMRGYRRFSGRFWGRL